MTEKQKKVRKYNVGKTSSRTMRTASLDTITGLYERFCKYKQTEGMSARTLKDYKSHFHYLMKFLDDEDISRNEMTRDLFREYISWMLYEQELSPVTVNVRIRTLSSNSFDSLLQRSYGLYLDDRFYERVLESNSDNIRSDFNL